VATEAWMKTLLVSFMGSSLVRIYQQKEAYPALHKTL
jgi:hypothetical protein